MTAGGHTRRWALLAPLALLAGAPPPTPADLKGCDRDQEPFLVAPAEVRGRVKTIAVTPVVSEREFSTRVLARMVVLDSLVRQALKGGGFAVVVAAPADSAPVTADAVLHATLLDVDAMIESSDQARWDGVKQRPSSLGGGKRLPTDNEYRGPTEALSFGAYLVQADGTPVYDGRGGIQLVMVPRGGLFVAVPESQLLTDRKRMAEAVRVALCGWIKEAGAGKR